ncbi:MAG TPA: ester cyclase [Pyrinomonadaceae bacterium]|nr:ester cyclase [Pyrinomonadaceae bacterium]
MNTEANKAVVRRFVEELWNGRRLEVADEIFAPECVTHQLRSGAEADSAPRDPETLKRHVAEWLHSFPDLSFTAEEMLAERDLVTTRILMRGTHAREWFGVAPTNRQVSLRMFTVHRFSGGRIVEDWVLVETLGFLQQLGLLPAVEEILKKASG